MACLGWLGWRLLDQERLVEAQRASERLEVAADRAARSLQRSLDTLERALHDERGVPPSHTVLFGGDGRSARAVPRDGLAFHPFAPPASAPPADLFQAAERAEFADGDLPRAIAIYRDRARSTAPGERADALLRLGRAQRKTRQTADALQTYDELARLGDAPVEGRAADLVAREARCSALEESGQSARLAQEAEALRLDVAAGRWPLTAAQWEFLRDELSAWTGGARPPDAREDDAVSASAALAEIWTRRADLAASGQALSWQDERPVLTSWSMAADHLTAVLAGRTYLETVRRQAADAAGAEVALADRDGRVLVGRVSAAQVVRAVTETRLPFAIRVSSANPAGQLAEAGARRNLLVATLVLVGLLILGSTYFTLRGIRRELAAARLQADFVSAVSHEFRTPLTSLRQLSQMLAHGRVISEDRRQQYYGVLVRESERLHRLVERLLMFGRAESGAARYRMAPLDLAALVRSVVGEFQTQAAPWQVEMSLSEAPCTVRGEPDLLSLALWNLLDNAVKYSPDCRTMWVDLTYSATHASLSVRDRGIGIPDDEQARVFLKFVRGTQTAASQVKGTGIGLALVHHVVAAHGGTVRLESRVRKGSTFTIELPIAGS